MRIRILSPMDVNGDDTIVDCNGATEAACRGNEPGYMFYQNLMGNLGDNLTDIQGLFTNIPSWYWSGTEYTPDPLTAWRFLFFSSEQVNINKTFNHGVWAVHSGDVDGAADVDGIADAADNCTLVANADQRDTNSDGYVNACDPDLDNNGVVNFADIGLWGPFFNTVTNGDGDFNGDGLANFSDYSIYPNYFLQPPGSSGVAP